MDSIVIPSLLHPAESLIHALNMVRLKSLFIFVNLIFSSSFFDKILLYHIFV